MSLPRAYLRIDPNMDSHPDPEAMLMLILQGNRQSDRGRFRTLTLLEKILGKKRLKACIDRRDIVRLDDGRHYISKWDEWQEGDLTVGERMNRVRKRRSIETKDLEERERNNAVTDTVTEPSPGRFTGRNSPSEALTLTLDVDGTEKDPGRSVKAETTETPNETPASDSTEGQQPPDVQQIGGEIRLTPQALGIRTDPGNFAQVQLSHDLTALVMAIGDPDKDPKAEAVALLHAISATPKGVKIETLDLRRVPSNWAAVTTHAAFKLAADHGVDLALVDGWRTARTPANAPEPKAPEMATASTEPRTCALCGGSLRSKGGLYICADSRAVGCTWMVRTDQPAIKSNAA